MKRLLSYGLCMALSFATGCGEDKDKRAEIIFQEQMSNTRVAEGEIISVEKDRFPILLNGANPELLYSILTISGNFDTTRVVMPYQSPDFKNGRHISQEYTVDPNSDGKISYHEICKFGNPYRPNPIQIGWVVADGIVSYKTIEKELADSSNAR